MHLTSPAFVDGGVIPTRFTQFGDDINPPLVWGSVPDRTVSFALVDEDPDVPTTAGVSVWIHWIVWNISPSLREIPEAWKVEGVSGTGTRGKTVYSGPRPPDREHRYFFRLYALDTMLSLKEGATRSELVEAMNEHVLAETSLMGRVSPQ